jgi:hypothetical protein
MEPMSTRDMLVEHVDNTAEAIRTFVSQIKSGEYLSTWDVYHVLEDGTEREVSSSGDIRATSEDKAIEHAIALYGLDALDDTDLIAKIDDEAYEPTTEDGTPISEYPLEIVDERGKEFAVVISTGGPHIEVVADGLSDARLEGYWWGERVTRYGDAFSTFLDYFIDREN